MKIETKYNLNDNVLFRSEDWGDLLLQGRIDEIDVTVNQKLKKPEVDYAIMVHSAQKHEPHTAGQHRIYESAIIGRFGDVTQAVRNQYWAQEREAEDSV